MADNIYSTNNQSQINLRTDKIAFYFVMNLLTQEYNHKENHIFKFKRQMLLLYLLRLN